MKAMDITTFLIIITAIISWQGFKKPEFLEKLMFIPYRVARYGEYVRFIGAGFVHGNLAHLLINLYVLYMFGGIVEQLFGFLFGKGMGEAVFALFYVATVVVACLPAYFRHRANPGYGELGASGATSALVMIYITMDPWQWFLFPPLPAIILGIGYLWYSQYMSRQYEKDHIAHGAHFAGALFGLAFIVLAALIARPAYLQQFLAKLLQGPEWPF
jgi:membrane associated rhomboid family serine protease